MVEHCLIAELLTRVLPPCRFESCKSDYTKLGALLLALVDSVWQCLWGELLAPGINQLRVDITPPHLMCSVLV